MAFSKDNRPLLPGVYFNEEAVVPTTILPAVGSVVAVPFTHTWGPLNRATLVTSFAQFEAKFGSDASPGRIAVAGAFKGEGVQGRGGAGGIICYRMGLGSGGGQVAAATHTFNNTAGTPVAALRLTAFYPGTRGNRLNVAIIDNAGDSTKTDIVVYDGTVEIERYTFADTVIADAATAINAASKFVTATVLADGVALGLQSSPVALTGGADGAALTATEWTAMEAALEVERFSLLAPYDLTDSSITASLVTWAKNLNGQGKRFRTVLGGGTSDSVSTAVSRATLVNHSDFVVLGDFVISDDTFGNLSSSQSVPRYAGILAARGEVESATFARLGGVSSIVSGPTLADKLTLFKGGVVSLGRDSNTEAPVRFERAVTPYTTTSDVQHPYVIYRNPKFVGTIHGIEMEFTQWAESNIIGQVPVNNKSRDALLAELRTRLLARVDAKIIQPNPTVDIDQNPPPSDDDEFFALVYGIKFGRSAEQVYNTLRLG